ncbi:MAG: DUF2989 domain-containing protein [Aestuariibacter sp.]
MRFLFIMILPLLLAGCNAFSSKSVASICEDYPPMCNDLNKDGWCRSEKAEIITTRYEHLQDPSAANKYKLMLLFEDYKVCVTKASGIEHIKYKDKKTGRVEGIATARRQLAQLARDTVESEDPHLLHYHWTRFGRQESLQRFLELENEGKLETPELQMFLAEYYVKSDLERTVGILHHALELHKPDEEINPEIFYTLSTIYLKLEKFPKAYLWGYIAKQYDVKDLDLSQIEGLVRQVGKNPGRIESIADDYISAIQSGEFRAPRV